MIMACAFCGSEFTQKRVFGRAIFWKVKREYFSCQKCSGKSLLPQITNTEMSELYDDYYLIGHDGEELCLEVAEVDHIRKYKKTSKFLKSLHRNKVNFLDYGCGIDGHGLSMAVNLGFDTFGVEISPETQRRLRDKFYCTIMSPDDFEGENRNFDVILLSDVLEHTTDPLSILRSLAKRLNPSGVIIVQGPLEGSLTCFSSLLRIYAWLTPGQIRVQKPYHVTLATFNSMTALFSRSELHIKHSSITETLWPISWSPGTLTNLPKHLFMLGAKLIDMCLSRVLSGYGSRFWIVLKNNE
jgi:SAM-dependent methyltransferase